LRPRCSGSISANVENSVIRASSHQSSTFVHRTLAAQNKTTTHYWAEK
jgi:hypothetical protein